MSEEETVTLRDFMLELLKAADRRYEERFKAQREALTVALSAAEKAVLKAEAATDKRFENVNEFRASLTDMANRMMPRLETEQRFEEMTDKLAGLATAASQREAKSIGIYAGWGYIVGAVSFVISVISVFYAIFAKGG